MCIRDRVNGYDTIFVEKAGKLSRLDEHFENDEDLRRIVQKFVSQMDRTIDSSNPIVDARLEDGSRVPVSYTHLRNCAERNYICIKMRTGFHSPVEPGSFYAVVSKTSGIGKNMSDGSGRLMDLLPVI